MVACLSGLPLMDASIRYCYGILSQEQHRLNLKMLK